MKIRINNAGMDGSNIKIEYSITDDLGNVLSGFSAYFTPTVDTTIVEVKTFLKELINEFKIKQTVEARAKTIIGQLLDETQL